MTFTKKFAISYYPKPGGALNDIYPQSGEERSVRIAEIERTGGMVVGRSPKADDMFAADSAYDERDDC